MRFVRHAFLAAGVVVVVAGGASAQTTGGNGTGTGTGTGSTGGTGTGSTGSGASTTGSTAVPTIDGGTITAPSSSATTTTGTVDKSNFLSPTYSNPYYQGLYSNPTGTIGQFGSTLYGTTGGGGSPGTTSTTGRTTSTTGRTTTAGGANPLGTSGAQTGGRTTTQGGRTTGGFTGGGLGGANSQFGGQVIPLSRNIAYSAVLRFPAPAVTPTQRVADVQAVLARSSMMANPAGVTVVQDGEAIVLRGAVANEDEARLAEGMVRLTPGVREVRNELAFPKQ